MKDERKTKKQLIEELIGLREENDRLKAQAAAGPPGDGGQSGSLELRRMADELEIIIDAIPGLVFYKDAHNKYLRVNKYVAEAHKMEKKDLEGKDCFDIYPREQAQAYFDDDLEVIKSRLPKLNFEEKWTTDEDQRWVSTSKIPYVNAAGEVVGVIGVAMDITERKLNEEYISRRNRIMDGINRVFQEALTSENDEDLGRACLAVAEELTGSRFGFIGEVNERGTFDTFALSDPGWDACKIPGSEALAAIRDMEVSGIWGEVIKTESSFIINSPSSHPARVGVPEGHPELTGFLGVPLKRGGKTLGVIALANKEGGYEEMDARAVEDLAVAFIEALFSKRQEEKIRKANIELEASNRELESFAYSVSHDLRAPLRTIHGFCQALMEDYHDKLDGDAQNYLDRVSLAAQRMGQLIEDLLKLSRITRTEMKPEEVGLSNLARASAQELRKREPDRMVDFVIQDGLVVCADKKLLEVAMDNLLGNAFKFTGNNPNARIEVGALGPEREKGAADPDSDDGMVYYVRDNGVGFDMQYADKLFGAFQRLHTTHDFPGTGIGLATVARVIHRHGGRIWAESEPEKGATFYFTLDS